MCKSLKGEVLALWYSPPASVCGSNVFVFNAEALKLATAVRNN